MSEQKSWGERLAQWTRFALLAAIAVVVGLMVTTPRDEISGYPRMMSRAQAEGICAAPGFLLSTIGITPADKLYLVDTNKQVICVYGCSNDQLRLQSARKYDFDTEIPEGSAELDIGGKRFKAEGGNGLTRDQAKGYAEKIKEAIDNLLKKHKKP